MKELHLGFNRIEELTDEDVENVPGIKLLDLRDNKVKCSELVLFGCTRLFLFKTGSFELKSFFVVTKFPQKWLPKGIENLPNLEYMRAWQIE